MPSFTLGLDGKVDLNKLLDQIVSIIGKVLSRNNFSRQEVGGGVFVSAIRGNEVVAAYYHPSKYHSATAVGGIGGGGTVKSSAGAGKWAIAYSKAGISGRKTYYNYS